MSGGEWGWDENGDFYEDDEDDEAVREIRRQLEHPDGYTSGPLIFVSAVWERGVVIRDCHFVDPKPV